MAAIPSQHYNESSSEVSTSELNKDHKPLDKANISPEHLPFSSQGGVSNHTPIHHSTSGKTHSRKESAVSRLFKSKPFKPLISSASVSSVLSTSVNQSIRSSSHHTPPSSTAISSHATKSKLVAPKILSPALAPKATKSKANSSSSTISTLPYRSHRTQINVKAQQPVPNQGNNYYCVNTSTTLTSTSNTTRSPNSPIKSPTITYKDNSTLVQPETTSVQNSFYATIPSVPTPPVRRSSLKFQNDFKSLRNLSNSQPNPFPTNVTTVSSNTKDTITQSEYLYNLLKKRGRRSSQTLPSSAHFRSKSADRHSIAFNDEYQGSCTSSDSRQDHLDHNRSLEEINFDDRVANHYSSAPLQTANTDRYLHAHNGNDVKHFHKQLNSITHNHDVSKIATHLQHANNGYYYNSPLKYFGQALTRTTDNKHDVNQNYVKTVSHCKESTHYKPVNPINGVANRCSPHTTSSSPYSSLTPSPTTSSGHIMVRQCRIGPSLAFGLVHRAEPLPVEQIVDNIPNGNGHTDGQGLVTIRMKPDDKGRFGFNVKGGADQGMPIIVSRVAPNTPADLAIPRLNEGDQVLLINGRDVSQHTHEQVVMFIKASRETHSGELALVVRPNVYVSEDQPDEPDFSYTPETHQIASTSTGSNTLDSSLLLLQESLESEAAIAQFEQLYRKKPGLTLNAARQDDNINKNRYRDISPYDQTRVILNRGSGGDYINANYVNMEIPGSGMVNRYIAAQGPLPNTCTDFWQMVWEQQSSLVVMLTTKVERGRVKCHQYWPQLYETEDFGALQITCVKEEETNSFAFREFNLTHVETSEERQIRHMQYIAWPDHGVPDDPSDFLHFVIRVRQNRDGMVEPTIVHCSAGIGRTGVLITMETAMCLIESNQPVYPLFIVRQMREQRAMLIQTSSQFKFVCEAILRVYHEGLVKANENFKR